MSPPSVRRLAILAMAVGALHGLAQSATLTTALEVHRLDHSAAARAYPVSLRAVVTFYDAANHLLFVQDTSDGIFVELKDDVGVVLHTGDEVIVTGVTGAGFAPNVADAQVRVVGRAPLPVPRTNSFDNATRGNDDSRWLELEGIVQRVVKGKGDSLLTLLYGASSYEAHVLASSESLMNLVDSEIRLQGVCAAMFNSRDQLLGFRMFVPGSEYIRVLHSPPPSDPFSLTLTPVADLLRFSRERELGHRVRVRGTVTASRAPGPVWIQDASGGVMVMDHDATALATGDRVDVVGFPAIAGFGPIVRGAQIKRLGTATPVTPKRISVKDAMTGDFDGQLVEIKGTFVDRVGQPGEHLVMEAGETIFDADLPPGAAIPGLEHGTRLRLTGISSVHVEQSHDNVWPGRFRLILRSPADVQIQATPVWFSAKRVFPVLAVTVVFTFAAFVWVGLLRRRVRTQTDALRLQAMRLQVAHEKTREALEKAREAESLDEDCRHIVELIARDEPVDVILAGISEAVALHCDGAACVVLLRAAEGSCARATPRLPVTWTDALEKIDVRLISFGNGFRPCEELSSESAWVEFMAGHPADRFGTFCSAPIVVNSAVDGAICAFLRNRPELPDGRSADLGVWANIAALALERRRSHDQLAYRAQHDSLTGLPNRTMLDEKLEYEIERASRESSLLGILYLDLNGFKAINDNYGHDVGDVVLREAARRMGQATRRGDTVARLGGDEFVVLLPLLRRREDAELIADKMSALLCEPIEANPVLAVSACIGIAIWPFDAERPDTLLRFADAQMYTEKKRQRRYESAAQ